LQGCFDKAAAQQKLAALLVVVQCFIGHEYGDVLGKAGGSLWSWASRVQSHDVALSVLQVASCCYIHTRIAWTPFDRF
jgi:hypothetical protein